MKIIQGATLLCILFFSNTFSEEYTRLYEPRPTLGLLYSLTSLDDFEVHFNEEQADTNLHRFNTYDLESTPIIGLAGNLPFNKFVGLNGIIGFQTLNFYLSDQSNSSNVGNKELEYLNLLIHINIELAYPIFINDKKQTMLQVYGFGGINTGRTFRNKENTHFAGDILIGYNYGAGARFAYGRVSLNAGLKSSLNYFDLSYDPEQLIDPRANSENSQFNAEWTTLLNPFVSLNFGLY